MGADAIELMHQIVLASRDNNTLWPHKIVARELRGALAIAVQKGNAMTICSIHLFFYELCKSTWVIELCEQTIPCRKPQLHFLLRLNSTNNVAT